MTAIQEAKDLTKLTVDELVGNLMTHELDLKEEKREVKTISAKGLSSTVHDDDEDSDGSELTAADELAVFVRRFNRTMGKGKQLLKTRSSGMQIKVL